MKLRALLRLCRIPNVFTAFSNVVAGVLLARSLQFHARDLLLVGATGALYSAGMILNDYFDRHVDAKERPDRPIVRGDIQAGTAALLGFGLLAFGLLLTLLHSAAAAGVGVLLALCILGYDALLKDSALGPLAMASCRFFNVYLGLSVAPWASRWVLILPAGLALFTLAITLLSRHEVWGTDAKRLRPVVGGFALWWLVYLLGVLGLSGSAHGAGWLGALLVVPLALFVLVRGAMLYVPLWTAAYPPLVGRGIGGGILLMPAIDAMAVGALGSLFWTLIVLAFALPAYLLKRWYYLT